MSGLVNTVPPFPSAEPVGESVACRVMLPVGSGSDALPPTVMVVHEKVNFSIVVRLGDPAQSILTVFATEDSVDTPPTMNGDPELVPLATAVTEHPPIVTPDGMPASVNESRVPLVDLPPLT